MGNGEKLDQRLAYAMVEKVRRRILSLPSERLDEVYSVILFGSLPRGDFLPGISDIDILLVLEDGCGVEVVRGLVDSLGAVAEPYRGLTKNPYPLDIPWIFRGGLPLKGTKVRPKFKFLDIYAFDFVRHSELLYGEDFRSELSS